MFSVHMIGAPAGSKVIPHAYPQLIGTLQDAITIAEFVLATSTINGTRPGGYRIMNDSNVVVLEFRV
jgi:hypothetical protein